MQAYSYIQMLWRRQTHKLGNKKKFSEINQPVTQCSVFNRVMCNEPCAQLTAVVNIVGKVEKQYLKHLNANCEFVSDSVLNDIHKILKLFGKHSLHTFLFDSISEYKITSSA